MTVLLYKPPSWTPLEALRAFRAENPRFRDSKLGYAGRLDPMAEGLLLVMVDEDNQRTRDFFALDKCYRVRLLFGVATDTFDALGLITQFLPERAISVEALHREVVAIEGTFAQDLPAFSAAPVRGKPLYYWARRGESNTAQRPAKMRTVYSACIESVARISGSELLRGVLTRIGDVRGDFRHHAISQLWSATLANSLTTQFVTATLRIDCSSGTFMRSIADRLGASLGAGAIALEIHRIRLGNHQIADSVRLGARVES